MILLALPRGESELLFNNDLVKGAGKNTPIEFYSSHGACPEPDRPPDPEKENAAPTAIGSGVNQKDPLKVQGREYAEEPSRATGITEALAFIYFTELFDEMTSFALSAREASRRGSLALVEGHFEQLVLVGKEIREIIGKVKKGETL